MLSLMLETNFIDPSAKVSQSKFGQIVFRDLQTDMASFLRVSQGFERATNKGVDEETVCLFLSGSHLFGLEHALLYRLEAFYQQHDSVLLVSKLLCLFKLSIFSQFLKDEAQTCGTVLRCSLLHRLALKHQQVPITNAGRHQILLPALLDDLEGRPEQVFV
jgi:hypothetical protein